MGMGMGMQPGLMTNISNMQMGSQMQLGSQMQMPGMMPMGMQMATPTNFVMPPMDSAQGNLDQSALAAGQPQTKTGEQTTGEHKEGEEGENGEGENAQQTMEERLQQMEQEEKEREQRMKEEAREEMIEQMQHLRSPITVAFYVRVILGLLLLVLAPTAFFVCAFIFIRKETELMNSVFISMYRMFCMKFIVTLLTNIADPYKEELDTAYTSQYTVPFSTNPITADLSFMSVNSTLQQELVSRAVTFVNALNLRLIQGDYDQNGNFIDTGDSAINELSMVRTITSGSKLNNLMYESVNCYSKEENGECPEKSHIYGFAGNIQGLESLLSSFLTRSQVIAAHSNVSSLSVSTSEIQYTNSAMQYDLADGLIEFNSILIQDQSSNTDSYQVILISLFIVSIVCIIAAYAFCFIPSRSDLFNVALTSQKISDLNPNNDSGSERSALGTAAWNDSCLVDCRRFDASHKAVALFAAQLCHAIDPATYECKHELEELEKWKQDHQFDIEKSRPPEQEDGGFGHGHHHARKRNLPDGTPKRNHPYYKAVSEMIVACFAMFSDEEHLAKKYKLPRAHRNAHYDGHAVLAKKLIAEGLSTAALISHGKPISQKSAANTIQIVATWLNEHVKKQDRELVTLILGSAPESEMEREVPLDTTTMPPSFKRFLDSDDATFEDSKGFRQFQDEFEVVLNP